MLQRVFNSIDRIVFGNKEQYSFEHRFLNVSSFLAALMALIGSASNFLAGLSKSLTIFTFGSSLVFITTYLLFISKRWYLFSKSLFFSAIFLLLDILWYENGGVSGAILIVYLSFLILSLLVWSGKQLIIIILLFSLNFLGLMYIEYNVPDLVIMYPSTEVRFYDIIVTTFLFIITTSVIVLKAKNYYEKEKQRAILSDQLKTAFLANISHEIRTPMNSIIGFSQLLDDATENERAEYIDNINKQGDILLKLINDIIDVAQIESDDIKLEYTLIDINKLFIDLKKSFDQRIYQIGKQGLEILIDNKDSAEVIIETDVKRLSQILYNLISNAIKYTDEGAIKLGYKKDINDIEIYVRDTGIGIPEKLQADIFQKFRKLNHNTNQKLYRGTGLGLFISNQLVKKLKGSIRVTSKPSVGSTFYIKLPLNY
ncbi:MAG: ATP-binding protein [Bacteroidales bacterium]|jgi:signal transduction histidine kinase|nr:ATP-binding protein [Bacteroidales bacterium]